MARLGDPFTRPAQGKQRRAEAWLSPQNQRAIGCLDPRQVRQETHPEQADIQHPALADHRFNQRATAEALGLTYDQLRHALKRHELLQVGG